ncbi:Septation initiation network scaffold protein cdc11 [Fulvia fulva]|nr:Septation initiation network scaffold protein cdc11 [Fulvia fulva]WPV18193.1 Septation initiation network scaffold protein cdc11 [Fulvia fulva]WPV32936.1 Septation initiation network scaffold protein cdc11 [Fulvia fulva]
MSQDTQNVAPWLAGLGDDDDVSWDIPIPSDINISSASHDANSIQYGSTRNSRRKVSGPWGSVRGTTQKRRSPLSTLSNSNNNTQRRPHGLSKLTQSRSFSGASDTSVVQYDTVAQRSKSSSPAKKQQTLEWKRRLLQGRVGYGDQTDLFGATGLENIFAQTPADDGPKKATSSMSWLDRSAVAAMPSSPPPWPSQHDQSERYEEHENVEEGDRLGTVDEEHESRTTAEQYQNEDSFESNPYDLQDSEDPEIPGTELDQPSNVPYSSPDRPITDVAHDNVVGNRTMSGQTDLDDFSPVFVSKHTTMTGQVEYKALDSRLVKQFQKSTVDLRHPSQGQSSDDTLAEPQEPSIVEQSGFTDGPESEVLPAVPDLSLSENLPTGTPPTANLGENVQTRRGGWSAEGSFKEKPLSPSPSKTEPSIVRHQTSELLSPVDATSRNDRPATPSQGQSEPRSRSSGSPLKLFGPHDTFTSNRLLRRMSQLDPDLSQIRSDDGDEETRQHRPSAVRQPGFRNVSGNSFGSGDLSGHPFNAEITITSASDSDRADSDRSPGSEVPPPGSRAPLGFRFDDAPAAGDTFKLKRKISKRSEVNSKTSTLNTQYRYPTVEDASEAASVARRVDSNTAAGKRPPNSPFKAPTPKRRRTLHASELVDEVAEANGSYHSQLQEALSGSKRRASRNDRHYDIADPDVLAERKMLRPRNPTPSQRRRDKIEAEIREAAEQFAEQEPEALEAVMEQIESSMVSGTPPSIEQQANVVANEVAKFSLRVQKASGDYAERKRSVTTQDFFNEAVMVMRLIREKAGRQSGLGSVAESDQEAISEGDQSGQDLSSLRVSRPPSREAVSGWRPRNSQPTDARVISHLRRFQERDDTEFLAQSVISAHADDNDVPDVVVDEHSNIRIRGPMLMRDHHADEEHGRPSTQHSQQSSLASHSSQNSDATSTGRTVLSRKSENLGNLAPDAVAHLIGEQVGAMTYDRDRQQWVKARSPKKQAYGSFLEPPSNITSDDDPFREISDLPVDEHKEEEIRKASAQRRPSAVQFEGRPVSASGAELYMAAQIESRTTSQETVLNRPTTRDSKVSCHTYSSSDPSRYTAFASSQQQTNETRATSWGDDDLHRLAAQGKAQQQPLAYAAAQAALAIAHRNEATETLQGVVEEDESCMSSTGHGLHGHVSASLEDQTIEASLVDETGYSDGLAVEELESPKLRRALPTMPTNQPSSTYRGAARQMSLRRKTLTSRFNDAETHEQSELSFVAPLPGDRMMSVSLSVSRPMSKRQQGHVIEAPSSPAKYDPSFMLSDLPDFTIHEEDKERPSEKALAQRLARHAAAEVDDRYALTMKDMVKILTDVKADEPYWEELKQLDLHDRGLASLHGLDGFCGRAQDLDVSNNKLAYLNGAPATVRHLIARSNQLSSLTPWSHLMNLQYLDISGNELQNLDGLSCLIHLRELKADDNNIQSLDGILHLDGLLKLRARRNRLQVIDFAQSQLDRLEELDLCDNGITAVQHVDFLPALRSLKLDHNKLLGPLRFHERMPKMRFVSLKDCELRHLNVTCLPGIRTLLLDQNCLSTVQGIAHLKRLDVISMRKQTLLAGQDVTLLEEDLVARTVHLSGNSLPMISLPHNLLSVQHLELASVGLQELPPDFGLKLPNLATLNLNFNSLKDIRPVLNINRLEQLLVCGSRLDRLRKTAITLSKLKTLKTVDIRGNDLTQPFYPLHACTQPITSVIRRSACGGMEDDEDTKAEEGESMKYLLPPLDPGADRIHYERMDEDAKLRRKVYHAILANGCPTLEFLDGLAFDKKGAMARDATWHKLVELGVLRKSGAVGLKENEPSP